jgi:hypothetical protein
MSYCTVIREDNMRQGVGKRNGLILCLLLLSAMNIAVAAGQEPAKPEPPPAQLEQATLPAAGRQTTLLNVGSFGRYSVLAASRQGTALQLVDRMAGPGDIAGAAGERDGRVDAFLERGQYQVVALGDKRATGTVRLDLRPFVERNQPQPPQLPEFKLIEDQLRDFEQLSYWIEVRQPQRVVLEAAGRSLADLRLWKDGAWLVDAQPLTQVLYPKEGQPLFSCRLSVMLDPGLYLLSAYGGPAQPWSEDSKLNPFYLRQGIPHLGVAGRRRMVVSPFGCDRFLVPGPATYFRLELPEARTARLLVDWFRQESPFNVSGNGAEISKKSVPPVAEVYTQGRATEDHIVEIAAEAGQPYLLQQFEIKYAYTFQGSNDYWMSTIHSGYAADSVDATAILSSIVRSAQARPELVRAQTIEIGAKEYWHRRVNLLAETNLFVHVKDPGVYQLVCQGAEAQYQVLPFWADRPQESLAYQQKPCGANYDLEAGYYVMRIFPVRKGIADLLMRPMGLLDSILSSVGWGKSVPVTPSRGSTRFGRVPLDQNRNYTVYVNQQPEVKAGIILRSLPLDLTSPLYVEQEPGEALSVPIKPGEPGTLRAEAEDGSMLEISLDGGPWETAVAVDTALHTAAIRHALKTAAHYSLSLVPKRLDSKTALPPISPQTLAALPKFPVIADAAPQFGDLSKEQNATYLLPADKLALYQLQSTGLLATAGNLRSRTNPSFVRKSQNGVGRNFSLQQYLREGDYQITVKTEGESAGHYGLELVRTPVRNGGFLTSRIPARATLEPGQAIAYYFKITNPGEFRVRAFGEGRLFRCRLEDKDGWPVLAPDIQADISRLFAPGQYRLVVLPEVTTARVVAQIEPTARLRRFKGHGPHALRLAEPINHVWMEPEEGQARTPDQWDFVAPAPMEARIELSGEMQADLVRVEPSGSTTKVAVVLPGREWKRNIDAATYRLNVTAMRRNNRAPYRVAVWPTELVAGLSREIAAPVSVPVSVGAASLVEISSFGSDDVQARLYDSQGKLIASNDDRPDDWNFQISRVLPAGRYRLDVDSGGKPQAQTTVSFLAPPEETQSVLSLPAQLTPVLKKSVLVYPIPSIPSPVLLAAAVESNENVGLAIEFLRNGAWQVLASRSDRSPRIQIPLGNTDPAGKYRLRLWALDRREMRVGLRVESIRPQMATEAQLASGILMDLQKNPGSSTAAILVRLDRAGLFQVEEGADVLNSSAALYSPALHEACLPAPEKKVIAWGDELWIAAAASQNSATPATIQARRLILASTSPNPLQIAMRNEGKILLDLAPESGGAVLLLASSQQGQPAVQLVERGERPPSALRNIAIAPRGAASALMSAPRQEPARTQDSARMPEAMVWAATPETGGLDVRLQPYFYAKVETGTWPDSGDGKLEGTRALSFPLAAGQKRVHLALGEATVAVLSKGNEIESVHWQGGSALNASIDTAADRLTLFHTRQEEDRFAVEAIPLRPEDLVPPLAPGVPFERNYLRSDIEQISVPPLTDPKQAPVSLHVRGSADEVTFLGNDGRVVRGIDFAVPDSGGRIEIKHRPGLVLCWLEQEGRAVQGLWPVTPDLSKAEPVSLPSVRRLRGSSGIFQIKTEKPILLHVRMAAGSVSLLKRASGEPQVDAHQEVTMLDVYLPEGVSQLCLRSIGGAELSASAEFTASPVTSIGEGLGPEVLLAPGDARLFSFEVKQPGLVGIGVRASADVVESELLSSSGKSLGKGTVQKANLQPGVYLLSIKAPAQGEPVRARAAVVGIVPPGTDPPEDVIRGYFGPEDAPPQFTSSRRAELRESEEYIDQANEEEGTEEEANEGGDE